MDSLVAAASIVFPEEETRNKPFPPKRTKVSQACDECRRKKIRCDNDGQPKSVCTCCLKSNTQCTFSRIQLKRGPSKRSHSQSDPLPNRTLPPINSVVSPFGWPSPVLESPPVNVWETDSFRFYYRHWHSFFPILPDILAELQQLLALPNAPNLVAAVHGSMTYVPIDFSNESSMLRTVQLMALMFIYLRTFDYTWLGAVVASSLKLRTSSPHGSRLFSIAAVMDLLHSLTHNSPRLLDISVNSDFEEPMASAYNILTHKASADSSRLEPKITSALSWLAQLSLPHARAELAKLAPSISDTPLYHFISILR